MIPPLGRGTPRSFTARPRHAASSGPVDHVTLNPSRAAPPRLFGGAALRIAAGLVPPPGPIALGDLERALERLGSHDFRFEKEERGLLWGAKRLPLSPQQAAREPQVTIKHPAIGQLEAAPADVLELDAFFGSGDPSRLGDPGAGKALLGLAAAGGRFQDVEAQQLTAYAAYQQLGRKDLKLQLELGGRSYSLPNSETLRDVAFLSGAVADPEGVSERVMALRRLADEGFQFSAGSPLETYAGRHGSAAVSLEGLPMGALRELPDSADVKALEDRRQALQELKEVLEKSPRPDEWQVLSENHPRPRRERARLWKELGGREPLYRTVLSSAREEEELSQAAAPLLALAQAGIREPAPLAAGYAELRARSWAQERTELFAGLLAHGAEAPRAARLVESLSPDRVEETAAQARELCNELPPAQALATLELLQQGAPDPALARQLVEQFGEAAPAVHKELSALEPENRAPYVELRKEPAELFKTLWKELSGRERLPDWVAIYRELRQQLSQQQDGPAVAARLVGECTSLEDAGALQGLMKETGAAAGVELWDKCRGMDFSTAIELHRKTGAPPEAVRKALNRIHAPTAPGAELPREARNQAVLELARQGELVETLKEYAFVAARPGDDVVERARTLGRLWDASSSGEARVAYVAVENQPKELRELLISVFELVGSTAYSRPAFEAASRQGGGAERLSQVSALARALRGRIEPEHAGQLLYGQLSHPLDERGRSALEALLARAYGLGTGAEAKLSVYLPDPLTVPPRGGLALAVLGADKARLEASRDHVDWKPLPAYGDGVHLTTMGSDFKPGEKIRLRVLSEATPKGLAPLKLRTGQVAPVEEHSITLLSRHDDSTTRKFTLTSPHISVPPGGDCSLSYHINPSLLSPDYAVFEVSLNGGEWKIQRFYKGFTPVDELIPIPGSAGGSLRFRFEVTPGGQYSSPSFAATPVRVIGAVTGAQESSLVPQSEALARVLEVAYSQASAEDRALRLPALTVLQNELGSLELALQTWKHLEGLPADAFLEAHARALGTLVAGAGPEKGGELYQRLRAETPPSEVAFHAGVLRGRSYEDYEHLRDRLGLEAAPGEQSEIFRFLDTVQRSSSPEIADQVWEAVRIPQRDETLGTRMELFGKLMASCEGKAETALSHWAFLTQSLELDTALSDFVNGYVVLHSAAGGDSSRARELLGKVLERRAKGEFSKVGLNDLIRHLIAHSILESGDPDKVLEELSASLAAGGTIEVLDDKVIVGGVPLDRKA
ncbi:MAG: hypothetical protein HY319_10730 [Armatimonadetes bacterium]|nr:hypothetical protein [Armatimonadota bacterium]